MIHKVSRLFLGKPIVFIVPDHKGPLSMPILCLGGFHVAARGGRG